MTLPRITLKRGKDVPVRAGHPWIFSEAVGAMPRLEAADLVLVCAESGEELGIGYVHPHNSIRIRMLTRDPKETVGQTFFEDRFRALDLWKRERLPAKTTGYRLVHAEADGLPGLIVDRYEDVFVFQLHTAGMDRWRHEIVEALKAVFSPAAIVERSDVSVRRTEGLADEPIKVHLGDASQPVPFLENNLAFEADVLRGQKTGFFLDQRDARAAVGRYAAGKHVVNLFGYTGAFSVYAAAGGATKTVTVDVSAHALEGAMRNMRLNGFDPEDEARFEFLEADVLELLRDPDAPIGTPDVIICDPPAFAKSAAHLEKALKAYTEVNQACLERLGRGGILVTSSCSGRVDPETFRSTLRLAAGRAHRDVRLREWIAHPVDHAERLAFPEGRYLKTAILEVVS